MAGSDSPLALGIGASAGVTRTHGDDAFGGDIRARLKLLRVLGAEVAYSPLGWHDTSTTIHQVQAVSVSGLFYFIPAPQFGAYLKAGIDAPTFSGLTVPPGKSAGYHAGGGFDFSIGKNLSLTAELVLVHGPPQLPQYDDHSTSSTPALSRLSINNYRASWGLMLWF
jgi:hypothetical protein